MKKIYESPDGGRTVYERTFGDTSNRKRISPSVRLIVKKIKKILTQFKRN